MTEEYDENRVYDLPMNDVFDDEAFNSRGYIAPLSVVELAREIAENGLIQPITVQPYDRVPNKKFRIVAGYRRFAAHKLNGAKTIRATVKLRNADGSPFGDLDARLLNLTENTQRQDLTITQEMKAIQHFILAGWTQDEIAQRTGKSRGWVQIRVNLFELPQEIQDEAEAGLIRHADILKLYSARLYGYDAQMTLLKKLKEDREKGNKRETKVENTIPLDKRKVRSAKEIFELQEAIQDACMNNSDPLAKVLGWAAGYVPDSEIQELIQKYIRQKYNRHYMIPEHLMPSLV